MLVEILENTAVYALSLTCVVGTGLPARLNAVDDNLYSVIGAEREGLAVTTDSYIKVCGIPARKTGAGGVDGAAWECSMKF